MMSGFAIALEMSSRDIGFRYRSIYPTSTKSPELRLRIKSLR
jgi:hypothetical protein